ncbi:MAG: D-alanine--D-alanine ligase [Candidatus Aminicenantes bacterium]|nr:D-alanine--D-alanine ligase [Candidatus Aminicenantes bacterium]
MTEKTTIALLFGGRSAEHEVSLASAAAIYKNLNPQIFDIQSIYINKEGSWRFVPSPLLPFAELSDGCFSSFIPWMRRENTLDVNADIYFPVLHGPFGEDGTIQGFFEMADVPYVGASVLASAAGMDKAIAKILFESIKLPIAKYAVFLEDEWLLQTETTLKKIREEFSLPLFVKPANLGSSVGISQVKSFEDLGQALTNAFLYDKKILIEESIQGREIECSVLGNDKPKASLPGEVIPSRDFYDYKEKYIDGNTTFGIPANLTENTAKKIQDLSIKAFKAIGCSGMARVDFFLQGKTNTIYLNEINTIPGFTEISMYPKLWEVSNIPFPDLLEKLISLGFEKYRTKKRNTLGFIS